jgi:hypothetical protein
MKNTTTRELKQMQKEKAISAPRGFFSWTGKNKRLQLILKAANK